MPRTPAPVDAAGLDRAHDAVAVTALGACSAAAFAWRREGELRVTVVVKAAFDFVPEGPMGWAPAPPIVRADLHHANNPARSVRFTTDLVPYLPRADVVLTGHAYAPPGHGALPLVVRLAISHWRPLLDKAIEVHGNVVGGAMQPFERMPLVYERAYGGIGFPANPLGVGAGASSGSGAPNLVDPRDPKLVACFGPLPPGWPTRRRMVTPEVRAAIEAPLPEVPAGFDWSYFQAAPPDQRTDYLAGDEWVLMQGLHPTAPQLRSRLPGARAAARVHGLAPGDEPVALALSADSLHIDTDEQRCVIAWRGSFPVPSLAALESVAVLAGVQTPTAPLEWPAAPPPRARAASVPAPAPAPDPDRFEGTMALDPADVESLGPSVPFRAGPAAPATSAPPPPRESARAAPAPRTTRSFEQTMDLRDDPAPISLPFGAHARAFTEPPRPFVPPSSAPAPLPTTPPSVVLTDRPADAPRASARPTAVDAIPVVGGAPVAVAVVPWGLAPSRDAVTIVVKATCDLVPGGPAVIRPEPAPIGGEVFVDGDRGPVLVHPTDRAPYKPRADVVLVGRAHSLAGPATALEASLRFGHEGNAFERRVRVHGDRVWRADGPLDVPSAPEETLRVPLTWERAFGGPAFEPNPSGLGAARARSGKPSPLPNLEDPEQPIRLRCHRPLPACFAPVPLAWKDRWARLGRDRDPWPLLPEDFDWTRWQAAPVAQQLAHLAGDEPFALGGVHPREAIVEGQLPGLRARCFAALEGPGDRVEEITLLLDTVVFDADAMTATLVWRGVVPVADESAPGLAALHVALEPARAAEGLTAEDARAALAAAR